jgi:hypothetical protein
MEPHGVISQKTIFVIVAAMKISQKTAVFDPTLYSSVGKLIKTHSTVTNRHNCGGDVARSSLPRPLWGTSSLLGRKIQSLVTLKMEAICITETSAFTGTTWRHIPEEIILRHFSPPTGLVHLLSSRHKSTLYTDPQRYICDRLYWP